MGLGNIERRIRNDSAYKRKEAELLVDKLEMMVTNIEKMKEDLKKIEKENKKEILENRDFYQKISKIRENMGLPKEIGVYEWKDKPRQNISHLDLLHKAPIIPLFLLQMQENFL